MNILVPPPLLPEDLDMPFDLEGHLRSYKYNPAGLEKIESLVDDKIRAYDPVYGPYLLDHLDWTSRELESFLLYKGYDADIAFKARKAFKLHDCGKTMQPGLWKITPEKQERTEEEKRQREMHGILGVNVIQQTAAGSGVRLETDDVRALTVAKIFALDHHERLDGSGPRRKTALDMCPILRAATIIDTIHGKMKAKDMDAIMRDMTGEKHKGQFDLDLLQDYAAFCRQKREPRPSAGIASFEP